jgi:hypothetical protein
MILLSFLPEIIVAGSLLASLFVMAFSMPTRGALPVVVSLSSFGGLLYFLMRPDLSFFEGPDWMILSDSFSFFFRIAALLALGGFSLSIYFHGELSLRDKQRGILFLQFFAIFMCGIGITGNLAGFMVSAAGMYFCAVNVVLVESRGAQSWIRIFREKSINLGIWLLLIILLFLVSTRLFHSIGFGDWIPVLKGFKSLEWAHSSLILLIILCGVMPYAGSRLTGRAPVGLAVLAFATLMVSQAFWIRVGVPVLSVLPGVPTEVSKWFLGAVFGFLGLRAAWEALRTREHHEWISAVYRALGGMVLFAILLPGNQAVSALFILTPGMLFTLMLAAHAFQDSEYGNKTLILLSLVAVSGAPPLVMGDRYYQMISDLLVASNPVAALGLALVWLMLVLASTQIIGKVILVRVSKENQRPFARGETVFLIFFLSGVIALSALRPQILAVLNRHLPGNLW